MRLTAFAIGLVFSTAVAAAPSPSCPAGALGTARTVSAGRDWLADKPGERLRLRPGEFVLTFDDGPAPGRTEAMLALLQRECLRATFFLIGKRLADHPETARKIRDAGHAIGLHGFTHAEMPTLTAEQAQDEFAQALQAARQAGLTTPKLFRYPGFKRTPALDASLKQAGLDAVGADISPADWRGDAPEASFQRLMKRLSETDRGVIVLHDTQGNTIRLVEMLVAEFKASGRQIVQLRD